MPPLRNRTTHRTKRSRHTGGRFDLAGTLDSIDRVRFLNGVFIVIGSLIILRLVMVQVIQHSFYEAVASDQHELVQQLMPDRGEIYAKDPFSDDGLALIATNRTLQHVYANPKQVNNAEESAKRIAPILGMDPAVVQERLARPNDVYEPLKHFVTDQEIEALEQVMEEQQISGIHWTPEQARYYPEGGVTATLTGFVGLVQDERKGQYGLEGYYDAELRGSPGKLNTELDAAGRFIAVGDQSIEEAQDGDMLVLTIDKNIQYKACRLLSEAVTKHSAKQGSVIVTNPKTGAILALCNAPEYDPNHYSEVEGVELYLNDVVSDMYEPGSVMKPITMAAALNEGKVTPYTTYDDTGSVSISNYTIRNSDGKSNGVVDMTRVLEKSLNTGAIYAVQQVGDARWNDYLHDFGFGKKTGVELSGEQAGDISSVGKLKEIYSATSSYGQGITVTPIQMAQAFGAIANGGVMMKPYIVDRVVKANGYQEETKPVEAGRPITSETARMLGAMMVRVIDTSYSISASVPNYFLAGKTGTAQIPRENGAGYDENRHKDTFVGFGPVSDPQFVIIVKMDEPHVPWSEYSTAPIFKQLSEYLVNYLHIPPDRSE